LCVDNHVPVSAYSIEILDVGPYTKRPRASRCTSVSGGKGLVFRIRGD
jgi:hypothetical protein